MVEIRALKAEDIQSITSAFAELGWNKPASQYEEYLADQEAERRDVLVATINGNFAGYLTIVWKSSYAPFQKSKIPEIVDFNVLPKFRRLGIGTQLMDEAEQRIMKRSPWVGIGVGLTSDYGAAQILYVKRGYIPNGRGISWSGSTCSYDDQVTIDDSLVLYFTKGLR